MYINVRTFSDGSAIELITIRWLVIDTQFPALKVYHFSFHNSSGPLFNDNNA
jgi:hypothetical protein